MFVCLAPETLVDRRGASDPVGGEFRLRMGHLDYHGKLKKGRRILIAIIFG